jgi:streptogramin lyase
MSLPCSFIEVREFNVPGVNGIFHISVDKSGNFWVSDSSGNLVQTDLQGNQLQNFRTRGRGDGYHTVTPEGELITADKYSNVIYKTTHSEKMAEFIKAGDWESTSIHSSHINGDIPVGMMKIGKLAKVTRYNKTGEEIQNIEKDHKEQQLYENPFYITENINGDVCVSDYNKEAVVVVNKSGQHRFSYAGQEPGFSPFGICTDVLGHILVCDNHSNTVHLLDQDGQFLSRLLTNLHCLLGMCVDDENNIYVGQDDSTTVSVYRYLQ